MSARPGAIHCSCSGSRGAQRRGGRSAPPSRYPPISGATSSAASERRASGSIRRVCAPGRGQRAFERTAEGAECGFGGRAGTARKAGGDEHPVVGQGEGRPSRMQPPPTAWTQQVAAARTHPRKRAAGLAAGLRPGPARRPEARARPVDHLDGAALRRRVGERAGERAQGLGVDARERRKLDDEPGGARVDVELARFVKGAPGQERMERGRHRRRRPRARRLRTLKELQQARQRARRHQRSLQPAGSSTTRTWLASR